MTSPENHDFYDTQLRDSILHDSNQINRYYRQREGEYARVKAIEMLGAMAAKYSDIPVFVKAYPLVLPAPEGVGFGIGEVTGKIAGFTYSDLGGEVERWRPSSEGVVMQVSMPAISAGDLPDAAWRLNALPEEMRNERIEGYIAGVPVTEDQTILQLGRKKGSTTAQSSDESEYSLEEYSYQRYVKNIQAITHNKPTFSESIDAAKIQAFNELMHNMVFECPYLGTAVTAESEYLRIPKPDSDGYVVSRGQVTGVLRKFVSDIYQDYQTKQWLSDVMAVIYSPDTAALVESGKLSAHAADNLTTTTYVPLSRPHVLATPLGVRFE